LAKVPVAVPGVLCVAAAILDHTGREAIASVGFKASYNSSRSVLGALQEALQVHSSLRHVRAVGEATDRPSCIIDEDDRVAFMLSSQGVEHIRSWVESFTGRVSLPVGGRPVIADYSAEAAQIAAGMISDGADPLVVDLTPRLPDVLRAMGWAVVKVIPVGYQALRMNEELAWSWNRSRLVSAEARTGLEAQFEPGQQRRPHPLP